MDALQRAEQCRAEEGISQPARILSHAASTGARDGADLIEDLLRLATRHPQSGVLVLRLA